MLTDSTWCGKTVSKWEQCLSAPDAELPFALSEALETPVRTLLGENVEAVKVDEIQVFSTKPEAINARLAQQKRARKMVLHGVFLVSCVMIPILLGALTLWHSPYLSWDHADPETTVFAAMLHAFELLFIRIAPFALIGAGIGAFCTRKTP